MPRPNAIEASMRFRRQLAQQEAASAERMGNIWLGILRRITPQVEALADDVAAMEKPTKGKLTKLARSQRILRQIAEQAARFGQTVTTEVELVQGAAIQQGLNDALKLMELSLPPLPAQTTSAITASFTRLPAEAVISAAGLLGDDSPLTMRLQDAYGEFVAKQVEEHLLDGIAAGQNPRRIASLLRRNVQDSAGKGLSSALTTIRTAQIKSYQIANHSQYAANPRIVPEWTWVAALDDRTCMSCVAQHGTTHPYTETMNDHHNGRCAPVPKTISFADLGINVAEPVPEIERGEDWFKRQPAGVQREMMGPGKHDAWKDNQFEIEELSLPYDDDVYGELLRERPLTGPNGLIGGKRGGPKAPEPGPTKPLRGRRARSIEEIEALVADDPVGITPKGTPTSNAINLDKVPKSGKIGPQLREAIKTVDNVHGDGELPEVPLKINSSTSNHGQYVFFPFNNKPRDITISRKSDHPMITYVHELGHFLDHKGLPGDRMATSEIMRGLQDTPKMQSLLDTIADSSAHVLRQEVRGQVIEIDVRGRKFSYKADDRYIDYLDTAPESFARAYSQYIAVKSRSPKMLAELDKIRNPDDPAFVYHTQWADDDFEPIKQAFDELFIDLGWLE